MSSPQRVLLFLWLICLLVATTWQCHDFGTVIVDGFQSAGSFADGNPPLQLAWPMLDGFQGYDQTWGFHWPGWPLLRSCLNPIFPFHPLTEMAFLAAIWASVAWLLLRRIVTWGLPWWLGFPLLWAMLTEHRMLIGLLCYRPEVIGTLLLFGLGSSIIREWNHQANRASRLILIVCAFALPMTIPEGIAIPIGLLIFWSMRWLSDKLTSGRLEGPPLGLTLFAGSLILGFGTLALWFGLQPNAWHHLSQNIAAQQDIPKSLATTCRLAIFSKSGIGSMPLFIGTSLVAMAVLGIWAVQQFILRKPSTPKNIENWRLMASLILLGTIATSLVTLNVNGLRLMLAVPWSLLLAASLTLIKFGKFSRFETFKLPCFAALLVAHGLFFVFRTMLWPSLDGTPIRHHAIQLAESLPPARMTYIPISLWEAAILDDSKRQYRFATFPNLALKEQRQAYEAHVWRDLQPGDLLVFDVTDDLGSPFSNAPNARMRLLYPLARDFDNHWELIDEYQYAIPKTTRLHRHWKVYRKL